MKTLQERFWSKVPVTAPDECWLWAGARRGKYGLLASDDGSGAWRGRLGAHRVSYQLAYGEVDDGLAVLHHCDTPLCVNPDHLFLGTLADNNRDRHAKGRTACGEHNGNARLTTALVREIRERAARGELHREIASTVGVSQPSVSNVIARRTWQRVA